MSADSPYQSVVFAGGGNRCIWQAGFWETVAAKINLAPKVVAGVSAGACMACAELCNRRQAATDFYSQVLPQNPKNFYPANILKGEPPFPHLRIYRAALKAIFTPEAISALHHGPEIRVLLAHPPRWAGAVGGALLGFALYTWEKHTSAPLHPTLSLKAGFLPEIVSLRDIHTPDEMVDLMLQTACTPPILPRMWKNRRLVLDGGLIDNVPVFCIKQDEGPTLVLLSRRYDPAKLKGYEGRTYIQPSRPPAISKWDYTNYAAMEEIFKNGVKDGDLFLQYGPEALQR